MIPPLALENGGYVGAAYVVFLVLLLVYVAIMAAKLQRIQRELRSLAELTESGADGAGAGARRDVGRVHEREEEISSVRQGAER